MTGHVEIMKLAVSVIITVSIIVVVDDYDDVVDIVVVVVVKFHVSFSNCWNRS